LMKRIILMLNDSLLLTLCLSFSCFHSPPPFSILFTLSTLLAVLFTLLAVLFTLLAVLFTLLDVLWFYPFRTIMPIYAPLAVWPYYFAPYVSRNPLLHPFLHTLCSEKSTSIRPKSLLRLVCNDLAGRPYGFQHVRGRVFPAQDPGVALFGGM